VAVPRFVVPAEKVTVPVGLDPVTLAFKVICPFRSPVLGEATSVVVVAACAMVTPTALEVLAVLLLSPG
jgi:hypothetical protein